MSATLNLCNLPAWIIASHEFNDDPVPLEIQGVRGANRFLFERLDGIAEPTARAETFHDYMCVKFYLDQWERQSTDNARRSIKNSYLRFLRGWGFDSNGLEGAVLKGWVESRIGIPPTFHREPIAAIEYDDYTPYAVDRMRGSARTNNINSQLDLLYTYAQYELARSHFDSPWLRLYRGTYDASEHTIIAQVASREYIVQLNNLSSFTLDRERAWEFGTTVWMTRVPCCKVFFFQDLLPRSILRGEAEHLVIGGQYRVKELRC